MPLPKLLVATTLLVFLFPFPRVTAETRMIHVVQLLDDNSPQYLIREGCRSISYGVEREVGRIQEALGIAEIEYHTLTGSRFNRESLEFVIDYELAYQERDIIILVYAGHGYREPGSSAVLPKLYFNGYAQAIEGDELRFRLLEKNPSLLINLLVACNTTQNDRSVAPGRPQDEGLNLARLNQRFSAAAYQTLFADQPGYTKVVDLISADREYETFMSRDGGIFFSEVLYAFQEVFSDQRLTNWDVFCQYVTDQTLLRTQERGLRQKPTCNYSVFRSIDRETVTITDAQYTSGAINCKRAARELRRAQRKELRALRHRHKVENRGIPDRQHRKLAAARHRQEVARMKYVHLQQSGRGC